MEILPFCEDHHDMVRQQVAEGRKLSIQVLVVCEPRSNTTTDLGPKSTEQPRQNSERRCCFATNSEPDRCVRPATTFAILRWHVSDNGLSSRLRVVLIMIHIVLVVWTTAMLIYFVHICLLLWGINAANQLT